MDDEGRVAVCERWHGTDWKTTIERIEELVGDAYALVDSTGLGDPVVETLQRTLPSVEGFKFSSSSKQQLMEGLAAAISQRSIRFPDGWMRAELDIFEFHHSRTGVKYDAPAGHHDDGVCALALAVKKSTQMINTFDYRIF